MSGFDGRGLTVRGRVGGVGGVGAVGIASVGIYRYFTDRAAGPTRCEFAGSAGYEFARLCAAMEGAATSSGLAWWVVSAC
ncbi:hypothetical protein GCM10022222_30390 [Amycolatopsis ultiminotia]|uniref:Uncharacterized protein n=1 Tax=Amycolatopsis ultiminotia TaxID=543629 RepID=A0ABP6W368_9PSEU